MSSTGLGITLRALRKHPGFAVVVVLSLALAIAVDTTMYSVLDALVHPRVDVREPDRLYIVRFFGDYHGRVTHALRDEAVRSGLHNIESFAWFDGIPIPHAILEHEGRFRTGSTRRVGPDFFDVVQPKILAGRTFVSSDLDAAERPLVVSAGTAEALFHNPRSAVGGRVHLNDTTYVVVGVLAEHADFLGPTLAWTASRPLPRGVYARLIRLRPGARPGDADRELQTVAARIAAAANDPPGSAAFRLRRANDQQFHYNNFHIGLSWAVAAILLIACANLANLQLARGIGRQRELALRAALGASRTRIIRQLLAETGVLAVVGLMLGLCMTLWGSAALRATIPANIGAYLVEPQMSWRVVAFAVVTMLACMVLVGLAPAIRVSRADPNDMLKSGAGTGATRRHRHQYSLLVALEIGLALALLSGGLVVARGSLRTNSIDLGFDPTPLAMGIDIEVLPPNTARTRSALQQDVVNRVRSIAGVADAATFVSAMVVGSAVVIGDSSRGQREIAAPGYTYRIVSPAYLRTMGIHVARGRDFSEGQRDEAGVIIDAYTARKLWPNGNPIGALIKFGDKKSLIPFARIVGVAGRSDDARRGPQADPSIADWRPLGNVYYLPGPGDIVTASKSGFVTSVVARASSNPTALPVRLLAGGVRDAQSMDDAIGITRLKQSREFVAELFGLFAVLGIGLAAFGVYGVVAHSVAERRRELGVRIALGADARDILYAVLRDSVAIALAGIAIGLLATKYGVFLLRAFAFEDDLYDVTMFAAAALALLAAAALSAFIPAMRATRVDPTESLRSE